MIPMQREIQNSLEILRKGGCFIYPTDTIWGIGCDATNPEAAKRIFTIKEREKSKSMIILVSSLTMLQEIVPEFPQKNLELLDKLERPTTVICKDPVGLAKNIVAKDNTVGIRWVKEPFCTALIEAFGKPIVSSSANVSGNAGPTCFSDIPQSLLDKVDYVVNLHRDKKNQPSSAIVKLNEDGEIEYLRK